MGRLHAGEQVDLIGLGRRIQIQIGVCVIERLALILDQRRKHQTGLHVVAVDHIVLRREIVGAAPIQEHRAVLVVLAVYVAVQVILAALLRCLDDGPVKSGVRAIDPAHHVGILLLHGGKVDLALMLRLGHGLRLVLILVISRVSIRVGVGIGIGRRHRLDELIVHVVLGSLCIPLVLQVADDLHRGKHQHTQQQHQHQVVQHLSALSASSIMRPARICGRRFFPL